MQDTTSEDTITEHTGQYIAIVNVDDQQMFYVIIEQGIVVEDLKSFADAVLALFGLHYALHLDYPKGLGKTFEVIQKLWMGLRENILSAKVLSLKNKLC